MGHLRCCLESPFAVRSDSNRHWFAAIQKRNVRMARSKIIQIAVEALLLFSLIETVANRSRFDSLAIRIATAGRDSNRAHRDI